MRDRFDIRSRGWGWRWRGQRRIAVELRGSVVLPLARPPVAPLARPGARVSVAGSFPVVRRRWRGLAGFVRS